MKSTLTAALVAVFLFLSGCAALESINNNPETADVVIKIAVSQYIDAEQDPALRVLRATVVRDKVRKVLSVVEGNPQLSLDDLEQDFRESIDWVTLDPSDKILADILISNVRAQLDAKVTVGEIDSDYSVAIRTLLSMIIRTTGYYGI